MATRSFLTLPWLLTLVLLTGGGLLVFGLTSLWQTARDAEQKAEREAERATDGMAKSLRRELQDPRTLDAIDSSLRFQVKDGQLVVGNNVEWLEPPAFQPWDLDLHWRAREAMKASAGKEFGERDSAQALELLGGVSMHQELSEIDRLALKRACLWIRVRQYQRHLDSAAPTTLNDVTSESLQKDIRDFATALNEAQLTPLTARAAFVQLDLIRAVAGFEFTASLGLRLGLLPKIQADNFFSRLNDFAPRRTPGLRLDAELTRRRRAFLKRVGSRLDLLTASGDSGIWRDGDKLLLWYPLANGGKRGDGAIVKALDLAEYLARDRSRLSFDFGLSPRHEARTLAPGLALLPAPRSNASSRTGALFLTGLLLLMALVFALTLFSTIKAVRREATAARTRAEFLTSVTHELKTPLASIRLLTEMLHDGRVATPEKRAEYHRLLSGESVRLSMLIENVLDLGRLERGERAYAKRPETVDEIVAETLALFEPVATRDGLVIEANLQAPCWQTLLDRGAFVQAILNLLENARKYAPSGERLEVSSSFDGRHYKLTIRDFGPGVPSSEQETIFERFVRGERQRDGSVPGVGLGLNLARSILRDHGGDLTIQKPRDGGGPGAAFVLSLVQEEPAS
ncbi:MAG: ATP-binding protein [Planctomycetota bacterium]